MIEAVVSKVITSKLKKYIEKVKGSQTQMKLWKGSASFDNLTLKATALSNHDLPLVIKKGTIGHVNVAFPWKALNTEPCIVEVSDVFIIANLDEEILVRKELETVKTDESAGNEKAKKKQRKETWQSLTNTIIDNARVSIKNVHIRLEYVLSAKKFVAAGFIVPRIEFFTVDRDNQPITTVQKFPVLRKRLEMEDIAMYFDTTAEEVNLANFEGTMQMLMSKRYIRDHQLIMEPLSIECVLVHTRNNPEAIKNQLRVTTKEIGFSVDFLQCRAFLEVSSVWTKLLKRRNFSHCHRPKEGRKVEDKAVFWRYMHRCARTKAYNDLIFEPDLAMAVLTSRHKYLKLYKKKLAASKKKSGAFTTMLSTISGTGNSLEKMRQSLGLRLTALLDYMSAEICKRQMTNPEKEETRLDISQLTQYLDTSDKFFSSTSFSAALEIPSAHLSFNFAIGVPLVTLDLTNLKGDVTSLQTGITSYVELANLRMDSHVNESPVPILVPILKDEKPFLKFEALVPTANEPHACQVEVAGFDINVDIPTIENASNFFVDFSMQLEAREVKTVLVDIGEYVRHVSKLRNTSLSLDWDGCYVTCPVERAPDQMTTLSFGLSSVSLKRKAEAMIGPEVEDYSMNYELNFNIEPVVFADRELLSSCNVHMATHIGLTAEHIEVTSGLDLTEVVVNAVDLDVTELLNAVESIKKLPIFAKKQEEPQQQMIKTIYTMDSVDFSLGFALNKIVLHIEDKGNMAEIAACGVVNDDFIEKNQINFPFKIKGLEALDSQGHTCITTSGDYFLDIGFTETDDGMKLCSLELEGITAEIKPEWLEWLKTYVLGMLKQVSGPNKTSSEAHTAEEKQISGVRVSVREMLLNISDKESTLGIHVPTLSFTGEKENEYILKLSMSVLNDIFELPVLDPVDVNLVFTKGVGESVLAIDLSETVLRCCPEVAHSVMRTLDSVLRLVKFESDSDEKEGEKAVASKTAVSVTLPSTAFEFYDQKDVIMRGKIGELATLVQSAETTKVEVRIKSVSGDHIWLDTTKPFADINEFAMILSLSDSASDIDLNLDAKFVNVSPRIACYGIECLPKGDKSKEEGSSNAQPVSTTTIKFQAQPLDLVVFDGTSDVAQIVLGSLSVDASLASGLSALNLDLSRLAVLSCVNDNSDILRLETPFRLTLNDVGIASILPEIMVRCDVEFLLRTQAILDQLGKAKSEEEAPVEKSSAPLMLMNIDVGLSTLGLSVINKTTSAACQLMVRDAQIVVRPNQKVVALRVDSCTFATGGTDKDEASVSKVVLVAGFGSELQKEQMNFELVESLAKETTRAPLSFQDINATCSVDSVTFSYSHRMANAVLGSFEPLLSSFNSGNPTKKQASSQPSESKLCFNLKVHTVSLDMWADKRLALMVLEDLVLDKATDISLMLGQLKITDENDLEVNLLECPEDRRLATLSQGPNGTEVNVGNLELWADYLFLATIMSYLVSTPFLKIQPKHQESQKTETGDIDSSQLQIHVPSIHLVVPTRTDRDIKSQLFHIKTALQISLKRDEMELGILSCSMYFSDPKQCINYEPIFDNFHGSLTRRVTHECALSYVVALSNIYIALSASDIVMFDKIRKCVDEAMKAAMIVRRESESKGDSTITNVEFTLGGQDKQGFEFVLCRDNRTAQLFIPLFKFSIPPVEFKMNAKGTDRGAVVVSVEPRLEYFNEVSGNWDLIVEPCEFKILAVFQHDLTHLSLVTTSPLNVNLPLLAVSQYMTIYKEIKSDVAKKSDIVTDYPRFWMQNCLGSFLSLVVITGSRDPVVYELEPGELIPTYHMELDSVIQVDFKGSLAVLCPQDLAYPTVFIPNVCVVKKSYKGGTLIQFNSQFQIKNNTCATIDVLMKQGRSWELLKTLKPHESAPIPFLDANPQSFAFVDHSEKAKVKNQAVKISPKDTEPAFVSVSCKNRYLQCVRITEDDKATGCRVFTLISSVCCVNLLPVSLYVTYSDEDEPQQISPEAKQDLLAVSPDKGCGAYSVSIDRANYIPMSSLKVDFNDIQCLSVYNETVSAVTDITVTFEQDEDTKQILMTFFSPCVIFNTTKQPMLVSEAMSEKCITVTPMLFGLWCPGEFLKDNSKLSMTLEIPKLTSEPKLVDCTSSVRDTLFLKTELAPELYIPIRYDIRKKDRTSVMTLSPFLTVTNELPESIVLQPILAIPKLVDDGTGAVGLASRSLLLGDPYVIEPGKEAMIDLMSLSGAFLLTVSGYSSSPALSFLTPQTTVFRVQGAKNAMKIIELDIRDNGVTYQGYIRACSFPTPIMIANCLDDVTVSAYQYISLSPFDIPPNSTSVFAYDEPFAYPSVHLRFADKNLHISLLENTETVALEETYHDKPILITISGNVLGGKLVTISCEAPEPPVQSHYLFSWNIAMVRVSLIDNLLREFVLVTLKSISGDLGDDGTTRTMKLSVEYIQADDQRRLSKSPTVIHGRKCGSSPFLYLETAAPSNSHLLSNFGYAHFTLQRIDCFLDASFISDWFHMGLTLSDSITHVIAPLEPSTATSSSVITLDWLEVSPIFLFISFKSTSSTPPTLGPMLKYFKYIPSISNLNILLPGLVVAHVSNTIDGIVDKITGDYKTIAFKQILDGLGVSGRIMTTFGIADIIAQALHIEKQTSLTEEISEFSRSETEAFDNRKEISGCFSQQALTQLSKRLESCEIETSVLIHQLLEGKETGLIVKTMPGRGFGHGVFGVLTRATMDTMQGIGIMQNIKRERLPRTFPGGHISVFDREISNALILIHKQGKKFHDQRIYIAFRCIASCEYICITDKYIIQLSAPVDKIVGKTAISKITAVLAAHNMLIVRINKKEKRFTLISEVTLKQACNFIETQRVTLSLCQVSLLT